jgi:hypothetical protein
VLSTDGFKNRWLELPQLQPDIVPIDAHTQIVNRADWTVPPNIEVLFERPALRTLLAILPPGSQNSVD